MYYQLAQQEFESYLNGYDRENDRIKLKIIHTYGVVKQAEELAGRMHLSAEDTDLARLIALLHDIGRFEQFAKDYDLDEDEFRDSITVFYPGREPNTSYKSHILNTTFEVIKIEKRKYWNENGCRAFRRQLVSDIRENNVIM